MQRYPPSPLTLATSYSDATQTSPLATDKITLHDALPSDILVDVSIHEYTLGSTGKGILIGMLSAFGSAAFVALILATVYFFRYTSRGQIFLDRIGRPGEYDDEQAFLREEEQALEDMDDFQRAEYTRAKGVLSLSLSLTVFPRALLITVQHSFWQTPLSRSRQISHYPNSWQFKKRASPLGSSSLSWKSPIASLRLAPRLSSSTRLAVYRATCLYQSKMKSITGRQRYLTNQKTHS